MSGDVKLLLMGLIRAGVQAASNDPATQARIAELRKIVEAEGSGALDSFQKKLDRWGERLSTPVTEDGDGGFTVHGRHGSVIEVDSNGDARVIAAKEAAQRSGSESDSENPADPADEEASVKEALGRVLHSAARAAANKFRAPVDGAVGAVTYGHDLQGMRSGKPTKTTTVEGGGKRVKKGLAALRKLRSKGAAGSNSAAPSDASPAASNPGSTEIDDEQKRLLAAIRAGGSTTNPSIADFIFGVTNNALAAATQIGSGMKNAASSVKGRAGDAVKGVNDFVASKAEDIENALFTILLKRKISGMQDLKAWLQVLDRSQNNPLVQMALTAIAKDDKEQVLKLLGFISNQLDSDEQSAGSSFVDFWGRHIAGLFRDFIDNNKSEK